MMKFEEKWESKTLEFLENDTWNESQYSSHLLNTCHALRKKQLKKFSIEDLRILIGQNLGLIFLIPLAYKELEKNILIEADMYEGDLLKSVLTSDRMYWLKEQNNWILMCNLFRKNLPKLDYNHTDLLNAFIEFEDIHS